METGKRYLTMYHYWILAICIIAYYWLLNRRINRLAQYVDNVSDYAQAIDDTARKGMEILAERVDKIEDSSKPAVQKKTATKRTAPAKRSAAKKTKENLNNKYG